MIKRIPLLLLLVLLHFSVRSQISVVQFSTGFQSPVDIKNCGDDRLFVVEERGVITIVDTGGVKNSRPFLNIINRVLSGGEQGLLGLAFPSDFLTSGYFYVNYTRKTDGATRISRFHVDPSFPDSVDPATEEVLLTIHQPFSNHNGGHIGFGPDGYLYTGMGDGGSQGDPGNRAQNPDSLLGKILRIAVNPPDSGYTIPPTNPFANDTTLGRPEVYTLGMRNPWRFSFDALTGDLWIGDVGQDNYEEVDMQPFGSPSGLNYGWKCWEANRQNSTAASCQPYSEYFPPVSQYSHTGGRCSVSGGYVYRGAKSQEMYGKYFYADYCFSEIQYLEPNGSGGFTNTNLGTLGATGISTFGVDRHGELYCAGVSSGIVFKFQSATCSPVATINVGTDTIDDCSTGSVNLGVPFDSSYTYLWMLNGDTVSTTSAHIATQAGEYYVYVTGPNCSNSDSVFVDFTAPVAVSFSGLDTLYCVYNSSVNLIPNHIPGTFTGPGITGASFDPALAGTGHHTITYDYVSPGGCPFSYSQDVVVDACLGVPENLWTNNISIYPNPSGSDFYIKAYANSEKRIKMQILDLAGRVVMIEEMAFNAGQNKMPIHSSLASGIYIVKFSDEVSSTSLKMIVQ